MLQVRASPPGSTELQRFNGRWSERVRDLVVSTNCELRLDGWPRSDRGNPHDAMSELNTARDQAAAQATQP